MMVLSEPLTTSQWKRSRSSDTPNNGFRFFNPVHAAPSSLLDLMTTAFVSTMPTLNSCTHVKHTHLTLPPAIGMNLAALWDQTVETTNSFSGTLKETKILPVDQTTLTLNGLPTLPRWPGLSKVSTPEVLMEPTSTPSAPQTMRTSFSPVMTQDFGESSTTPSDTATSPDATEDTPNSFAPSFGTKTTKESGLAVVKTWQLCNGKNAEHEVDPKCDPLRASTIKKTVTTVKEGIRICSRNYILFIFSLNI